MTAQGMAQSNYPLRSIQIIVPFTVGGGNDLLARVLAEKLQKWWGQPVIVENKPGAGGNIGTEAMLHAPADGYTLLSASCLRGRILVSRGAFCVQDRSCKLPTGHSTARVEKQ
jgi:tripartite-type tricarboxylate transporter receptor subunit TctC